LQTGMSVCFFRTMNDTKEKILIIALRNFLTKSYIEVTMSEILKESGVSKGGFYHHFESKEALYHEVVDRYILKTLMSELSISNVDESDLSFHDYVISYLGGVLKLADSRLKEVGLKPSDVNLYMIMFDLMRYYNGFVDILNQLHEKEILMLELFIDKAKKKGEIKKELDSQALANHIHTLMHGISVLAVLEESMDKMNDKIKAFFSDFYRLIKA
jgi:TetR/AcrR family transcriptional regulator, transcriptional repressor for nem operon